MPGPSKGYVSKSDPRRKRWESLQGTSAGGSVNADSLPDPVILPDGTAVGPSAAGGTSAGPTYQPPSAVQALRSYRQRHGSSGDTPEARAQRQEKRKAENLSAARSIVSADLDFQAVGKDRKLEQNLRRAAIKDRREKKAAKQETTREINEQFRSLTANAPTTLAKGARNRTEAASVRNAIRSMTQKDRDLYVAASSREDWKDAEKNDLGVTEGIVNPWQGTSDKTPARKQRRTLRSLVRTEDETGVSAFPSGQQQKVDQANFIPELVGLDLSPVDIALMVPGVGWAGKALKGGRVAIKAGEEAAGQASRRFVVDSAGTAVKEQGSILTSRSALTSAARATKTGKRIKRFNEFMESPLRAGGNVTRRQAVRRTKFGATAGALAAGTATGDVPAAVEGGYKAVTNDPTKVLGTTSRNLLSMFTAPLTIAANLGLTAKRLPKAAIGEEGQSLDRAISPTRQVGEQMLEEAKHALDVWTSKDPNLIAREVQDTYGLTPYLVGGALIRPGFRGLGKAAADATINKVPVPFRDDKATIGQLRDRRRGRWDTSVQEGRAEGDKQSAIRTFTEDAVTARQMLNRPEFSKLNRRLAKFNKRREKEGGVPIDVGDLANAAESMGLSRKLDRQQIQDILRGSDVDVKDRPMLEALLRTPEVYNPDTPAGKLFNQMRDAFQKATPYVTEDLMDPQQNALKIEALATADRISRGEVERGVRDEPLKMPKRPEEQLDEEWDRRIVGNQEKKNDLKKSHRKLRKKEAKIEKDEKKLARQEGARAKIADLATKVLDGELNTEIWADQMRGLRENLRNATTDRQKRVIHEKMGALERKQRAHRQAKKDLIEAERDAEDYAMLPEPQRKARRTRLETRKRKAAEEREALVARGVEVAEESRRLRGTTTKEQRQAIVDQIRDESAERRADLDGITPRQARERREQLKADMDRVTEDIAGYSRLISEPRTSRADRRDYQRSLDDAEKAMDDLRRERDELRALTIEEINPDLLRERVAAKKRENLSREQEATREAIQSEFDAIVDERMEIYNLAMPSFIRHQEIENPRLPESRRTTRGNQGYSIARTYQRTGKEAQKGAVDRSFKAFFQTVEGKAMRDKNRHLSGYVARNHMFERENRSTGLKQRYLTDAEFSRLPLAEQRRLERDYYKMDQRLFTDPGKEGFQRLLGNGKFSPGKMEELNRQVEATAVEKRMGKGEGTRYAYVEKGPVDRIIRQENDLNFAEKILTELGLLSSRLTLGLSVGWAAAQPIAEMMTLMAAHPNPIKIIRAFIERSKILKTDPEAARDLRMLSGNTLGTDPATAAALGRNSAASRIAREWKRSPEGELALSIVKAEVLGKIDRWKGAAIREVGALMEIDRNLKQSVRASKAVNGVADHMESIADELARIPTEAGRVKYLFSEEGIRAGEQLMKDIDDALGNWTTVGSRGERAAAGIMFFYPFIRFSMKWVFQTYPRDHPIRYALLSTLGVFNAEMIEDIIGDDPTFLSDWAMVPVFGEEGRITNLFPVNRLMGTGNSVLEQIGNAQNPLAFLNVVNPLAVGIPLRNIMGRDQFGQPVEDPYSDDQFTFGDTIRGAVDQATDLAWPLREIKRSYNIELGPNGLSFSGKGREGRPGDNPDGVEEFIRRMGGPLAEIYSLIAPWSQVGIPAEVVRDKHMTDRMWEQYTEGRAAQGGSWSAEAKAAQKKDEAWQRRLFNDKDDGGVWKPRLKKLEDRVGSWNTVYGKELQKWEAARAKWKEWRQNDPGYAQYVREQGEKDEGKMMADIAAYTLNKLYQASGDEMPTSKAINDGIKRANELLNGVKPEPKEVEIDPITGKPIPDEDRMIIRPGDTKIPEGARAWSHVGSVKDLPSNAPAEAIERVAERDPKIGGNFTPQQVARLRKLPVARKMKFANRVLDAKEKYEASMSGGAPSGVPKQYRAAVAKWGKWLEKEMRKNGLVEKDDSYVGGGLPKSMSGPEYLAKIIQGESNWNPDAGNGIAFGLAAFTPETRQALLDRTGTDAYAKDNESAVKAAAELLSGSVEGFSGTMDGYNPGFPTAANTPEQYRDGTWGYYFNQDVGQPTGGKKGGNPQLKQKWLNLVAKGKAMGIYEQPEVSSAPVKLDPSAAGTDLVGVNRPVKVLAKYLARSIGETDLPILSGKSNHSQLTTTGNVSEHWEGNALDITAYMDGVGPGDKASQERGDTIARNAIVALGGTAKEAREYIKNGRGIFDAPGGQVIWGTNDPALGGNHTDHVHVSAHKVDPSWLPQKKGKTTVDKLPGPWDGSREMVRQITGMPQIRGDHAFVEGLGGQQDEVGVHPGTEHNDANAYAQDINSNPGYAEREGEPPFNQETMDTIVKNLRSMGADVPDLSYVNNPGWSGKVGSYNVFIEGGISNHIHVGATYVGGGDTPVQGMGSIMERQKAKRYGSNTASSASSASSAAGATATGGGGPASTGSPDTSQGSGNTPWENLQAFRIGSDPNQKVPLWGGGSSSNTGTTGSSDFPSAIFGLTGMKTAPEIPKYESRVESESDPMLGLPTFEPPVKRKKKSLAS